MLWEKRRYWLKISQGSVRGRFLYPTLCFPPFCVWKTIWLCPITLPSHRKTEIFLRPAWVLWSDQECVLVSSTRTNLLPTFLGTCTVTPNVKGVHKRYFELSPNCSRVTWSLQKYHYKSVWTSILIERPLRKPPTYSDYELISWNDWCAHRSTLKMEGMSRLGACREWGHFSSLRFF